MLMFHLTSSVLERKQQQQNRERTAKNRLAQKEFVGLVLGVWVEVCMWVWVFDPDRPSKARRPLSARQSLGSNRKRPPGQVLP